MARLLVSVMLVAACGGNAAHPGMDAGPPDAPDPPVAPPCGGGEGFPSVPFVVGVPNPVSIAAADLDGDGHADLAVASLGQQPSGDAIHVLRGAGDGTFSDVAQLPTTTATAVGIRGIATADLDRDGHLDLIAVDAGGTFLVRLGTGDGSFQDERDVTTFAPAESLALGDFDGDGITDVAFTTGDIAFSTYTVRVMRGLGDGTFAAPITVASSSSGSFAMIVGDFDRDSRADIAASDGAGGLAVYLGAADGSFATAADASTDVRVFAAADLDGDGHLDLVVNGAALGEDTAATLHGNGDGTFAAKTAQPGGAAVAVGDLDGDGVADIATHTTLLHGAGDGTFAMATGGVLTRTHALALVDLNGDGTLDAVGLNAPASTPPNAIVVLLGNGAGFDERHDEAIGEQATRVELRDLDHDGNRDLITLAGGAVHVALGNGDGTFHDTLGKEPGALHGDMALGDINGDGELDLATTGDNAIDLWSGNGTGVFSASHDAFLGKRPSAVALADLDGDGKPDLVVIDDRSSIGVLLGNGDFTFGTEHAFDTAQLPIALVIGDFDGDGNRDVAVATLGGPVSVLLGNGDGTFADRVDVATGGSPGAIAMGDVDRDGVVDLVVADAIGGVVRVLKGKGDGTFAVASTLDPGAETSSVTVADVDGDGVPDVVTANAGRNTISVWHGAGDGTFQPQVAYGADFDPLAVAVGDLDGDGHPDLAVANDSGAVSILRAVCR